MPFDNRQILIVGATGLLGRPVVHMLDHFGLPVRIMTRSTENAERIFGRHFDIVQANIEDYDSLLDAANECFGVHINLKGGPKSADFDRIEHQGTARIVKAARQRGVKRITYLSGASVSKEHTWFKPIKAKYDAEQAIRESGLEYIIFRATWFMESLPYFVKGKQATVIGKQPHKFHWLAAEDYARMVAGAMMLNDELKHTLTLFGPEDFTFEEALKLYAKIIDPEIRVASVPIGILKFTAAITFSRKLKGLLPLMKYFEDNGELGDPAEADALLGQPGTTLENWYKSLKEKLQSV
jgi:uncharacterized protein YbjT (DUF2867 family)